MTAQEYYRNCTVTTGNIAIADGTSTNSEPVTMTGEEWVNLKLDEIMAEHFFLVSNAEAIKDAMRLAWYAGFEDGYDSH